MKAKYGNLFWGLILILAGGLFLAQNMGYLEGLAPLVWAGIFAAASLLFLIGYLINGLQNWGWLFPTTITAGVALTIYLAEYTNSDAVVGAPVLIGVGLPFAVAFLLDPRRRWWAMIPAWIMIVLTLILFFVDRASGEWIGALVLFSIALPFLAVYLVDRTRRWALIPAFVLTAVGIIPILVTQVSGETIGAYVTLMIALPFFVVYFWSPKNWWALVPAGVMGTIAISLLVFQREPGDVANPQWMAGFMFLGWALTFGALWLRRKDQATAWAGYPALGLALASALAFIVGDNFELYWPIIIIAVGITVLFGSLRNRSLG